ncbi:universal stress protein [Sulfurospirillum arcachonense]|uniref:universal stress protein n=1 Tax=Sulfurospirillum arcachonense TaxID=57666 RepID=UPI0004B5F82F|nr:universal stress protein [Sulfurospirillum arcachonense]
MLPKKVFLPLGGGDELNERIKGALLIAKYLGAHLEVLRSETISKKTVSSEGFAPKHLIDKMNDINQQIEVGTTNKYKNIFKQVCDELNVKITKDTVTDCNATASLIIDQGLRSTLVAQYGKLCDMVIAACPPGNVPTATFKAAVLHSGKPVMMIPRVLDNFDPSRIIIFWNATTESSRAIDGAMPFLVKAKEVLIVTRESTIDIKPTIYDIKDYLSIHNIEAKCAVVVHTKIRGEALLKKVEDGNYGLIVAGAYAQGKIKEKVLGGLTTYLLKHTKVPVLSAH